MAGFAEDACGRADEDERAVAALGDAAEEAARSQEARGQIRVEGVAPALEGQLPDRNVFPRPDAGDRGTDVERAGSREQFVDLGLVRQVGAGDQKRRRAHPRAPLPGHAHGGNGATTSAALAANARALADPIPPEAPVTSTRFPPQPGLHP